MFLKMAAAFNNQDGYHKSETNLFICDNSAMLLPNLTGVWKKLNGD